MKAEKRKEPDLEDPEQEQRIHSLIQEVQDVGEELEGVDIALPFRRDLPHQFEDDGACGHPVKVTGHVEVLADDVGGLDPDQLLVFLFIEMQTNVGEQFEPRAEPAEGLPAVPGNAPEPAAFQGKEGDQLVRFSQVHGADDDGFGFGFHNFGNDPRSKRIPHSVPRGQRAMSISYFDLRLRISCNLQGASKPR